MRTSASTTSPAVHALAMSSLPRNSPEPSGLSNEGIRATSLWVGAGSQFESVRAGWL